MSRNFHIVDAPQRSEAWIAARLGKLTGSVAGDIFATVKTGEAAARRNLRIRLVLERLTNRTMESTFASAAMQVGIDREADARTAYEIATGNVVFETGFLAHDTLMAGASIDGHLGSFESLVSLKCRQPAAHLDFIRRGTIPADALAQIRHELWLTGAKAHHYVSWSPDFPERLQLKVVTLQAETMDLPAYELAARLFLSEVDAEVQSINALRTAEVMA